MTDEQPETAAAELALGVLDGEERAAATRRVLAEPAFAAEAARWRTEFAALFDAAPAAEPPPTLFGRIERGIDGLDRRHPAPAARRRWLWPSLAGVSSAAAAALLALVVLRPAPAQIVVRPAPTVLLAAAMTPTAPAARAGEPMSAVYDARAHVLRLSAANMVGAGHSAELWVIGGDGVPYSLGLLRPRERTAVPVTEANRRRLLASAVLAISIEPVGGSPTGQPTGPVVVKGPLLLT